MMVQKWIQKLGGEICARCRYVRTDNDEVCSRCSLSNCERCGGELDPGQWNGGICCGCAIGIQYE